MTEKNRMRLSDYIKEERFELNTYLSHMFDQVEPDYLNEPDRDMNTI
ncbi:hypothetical protein [Peribacillus kribbensis]|nr:hypothetical protein [Peribacillus kribbensis]